MERLCEASLRRFREHRDAAEAAELEAENILDRFTEVRATTTLFLFFDPPKTHFIKTGAGGFQCSRYAGD